MDWISVGIAAVSGALAAGLASLLVRNRKTHRIAFAAVLVVSFAMVYGLLRQFASPQIKAWNEARNVESSLQAIPTYQAIKRYDPQTYDSIVADLKSAVESGADETQMIGRVRDHITRLIRKRLPSATDEAAVAYMKVMLTEMNELSQRGGDLCYRFLFPQHSEPIDGRKYFSAETQAADLTALTEVIRSSNEKPQPIPSEQEIAPTLKLIYAELGKEHGKDLLMLQSPVVSEADKAKVCTMATSLYAKILKLPRNQSGKIFRFMMSRS